MLAPATLLLACGLSLSDETTVGNSDVGETGDTDGDDTCSSDDDCTERAEVCGPNGRCIPDSANLTTTCDDSQEATFSAQPLPLFRGELCTVKGRALKAGWPIPITVRTCHHPCVAPIADMDGFQPQWECAEGECEALLLSYFVADGDACPEDAWEEFAQEDCVWSEYTSPGIGPVQFGEMPIEAAFNLEVPYLSNKDLKGIVEYMALSLGDQESDASDECVLNCSADSGDAKSKCLEDCMIKEVAYEYGQQGNRMLPFELRNNLDDPPETCSDGDPECECYTIGL